MKKSNVMTLRLPPVLKHRIELVAEEQGISENQLALYMITKEIAEFSSNKKLFSYWQGKRKKDIEANFDKVLSKIQEMDNEQDIPEWDKK